MRFGGDVISEAVTRQVHLVDGIDNRRGVYGLTMDAANLETLKTRLPRQLRSGAQLPMASLSAIDYANSKELT